MPGRRACALLLSLALAPAAAAALTIDDFADASLVQTTLLSSSADAQFDAGGILGGERDVSVTRVGVLGTGETSASTGGGLLDYLESGTFDGTLAIHYDGDDGSAALDATGLGGIDLTEGGLHAALLLPVASSNDTLTLTITVRTDAINFSTADATAFVSSGQLLQIDYSDFTVAGGAGADFSNVGSLSLELPTLDPSTALSLGGSQGAFRSIAPEPGTGLLVGLGLGLLGLARRRRA